MGTVGGRPRGGHAPLPHLCTLTSSEWKKGTGITHKYRSGAEQKRAFKKSFLFTIDRTETATMRSGAFRKYLGIHPRLQISACWIILSNSGGDCVSLLPLCVSRGGGKGGGGENSGGVSSSFESSLHESCRGRKASNTFVFVEPLRFVSPVTDLQRRVAIDVLGTFNDGEVGEAKLICCLNQAHTTASHLQQHFTDPHRGRVLAAGHLHTFGHGEGLQSQDG